MDSILVFLALYAVLVITDLIPVIRSGKKKEMVFSFIVYAGTLFLNILLTLNLKIPSLYELLKSRLPSIFS